ncbi:hypothetical protein [Geodermatophilus marinus]|uniref:hypothetical protein n=1 Tax=Geodermatophilus sp. LHW52908 TaxID=2303986 RepID=UPI000E3B650C|nr:hypothetical protein [Geodermatophilus sp. LHW52908]RFU22928.1 hypothetical protein D0Z06_03500 [Geodermatophilus sp. LHW52908]
MTPPAEQAPALVAGEVRGFRRFRLTEEGLRPPVQVTAGAWSGEVEHARCLADDTHAPPVWGCGCGLYGWYHPSFTGSGSGWGNVTAVVAARGRVILADHGFRAAAARVEAVTLPLGTRLRPRRRERYERLLRDRYPRVQVYRSRRGMLQRHPPDDLSALGIAVRPDPGLACRRWAVEVWLAGVLVLCSVAVVPGTVRTEFGPVLGLGALTCFVVWQVILVRLVTQAVPPPPGTRRPEPPGGQGSGAGPGP